jgi:ZIP family zinc transporter
MSVNPAFGLILALFAGLSTGIGSVIAYFIKKPKPSHMALILGFSAGVMLYVSFVELFKSALDNLSLIAANAAFFGGIIIIALLDVLIPHEYKEEHVEDTHPTYSHQSAGLGRRQRARRGQPGKLRRTGLLLALGIAIHNFPEGLVVFSGGVSGDTTFGLLVATAIALHNIPEGISVSVPIAEATGDRKKALLYSFAAGLAEPVGALLGYVILFNFLTPSLIYSLMAFAAGVMVYISLDELLPTAHQYGKEHVVLLGILSGMIVMALSIIILR